jgi:hypothetical protein
MHDRSKNLIPMKCCDAIGLRLGVNGFQVWQKRARFPGWVRRSLMPSYGLGSMARLSTASEPMRPGRPNALKSDLDAAPPASARVPAAQVPRKFCFR